MKGIRELAFDNKHQSGWKQWQFSLPNRTGSGHALKQSNLSGKKFSQN